MENTEVISLLKDAFELKRQGKYKHAMELLYKALALCPENSEILSQIADIHMLLDNPQSAGAIYERLAAKQIDDVEVMQRLCSYYMACSNYDKAKLLLEKFILSYPSQKAYETYLKNYDLMNQPEKICEIYTDKKLENYHSIEIDKYYSISLYKLNKIKEAKKVLERIAPKSLYDDELQYYFARVLYTLKEISKAYVVVKSVLTKFGNPKLYNLRGEIELDNQKYEAAIAYFTEAVKLRDDASYYYNLATAYFLNGQLNEAKEGYLKTISMAPDVEEYRYSLAYLFYKQNDLKKSRQIVDELLKDNPEYKDALFLNVNILYDEQKYFMAHRVLDNYAGEKNGDEEFLTLSAKVNRALYKLDAAQHNYEQLILLQPENMDYKLELARLYFDRQQYMKSAKLVVSIMAESPKYINAYILAAKIYIKMYDFANVVKMTQTVLSLDLNNEEALYLKALGQMGKLEIDDAIKTAKQLLDYNPHKSEAYALLGAAYMEKLEYEVAEKYYLEAISVDAKNPDYFFSLALMQEKLGKMKEALRHLYVAYSLNPENKQVIAKLVGLYIKEQQYKNAIKLLSTQVEKINNIETKKDLISQIKEIESLYKKNCGIFKYIAWKLFKN